MLIAMEQIREKLVDEDYEGALQLLEQLDSQSSDSIEAMYLKMVCFTHLDQPDIACIYGQTVGLHPSETNPEVLLDCLTVLTRSVSMINARTVLIGRKQCFINSTLNSSQTQQLIAIANALELFSIALEILESQKKSYTDVSEFFLLKASLARSMGDIEQEKEALISALESNPNNSKVHAGIAHLFDRFEAHEFASEHNRLAESTNPDGVHPNIAMDFYLASISKGLKEQERLRNLWLKQIDAEQSFRAPFGILTATDDPNLIFNENLKFSECAHLNHAKQPLRVNMSGRRKDHGNKIRIGYFSPDFRNHAVTHLVNDLLVHHDRSKVEIFGFSIANYEDSTFRANIETSCDDFFSVESKTTEETATLANSLKLDFAIDLAGYTKGFRPQLFERLKQTRIVNYLGYPSTVGANFYDYIIGDKIVTPDGCDKYFSEKIIKLNRCYQCNSPSRQFIAQNRLSAGLPTDKFIFCNFNARQKMNIETLYAWAKIIERCPEAVLWVLDPGEQVRNEFSAIFCDNADRIIFAPKVPVEEHLGRVALADAFLDSFPYGAHTTASDAVFNGIPVITMSGHYFQSRVSWSLMHHSGLSDLNSFTWEEFIETAVSFYQQFTPEVKSRYKEILLDREAHTHPYNIGAYTQEFETILTELLSE